MSKIEEEDQNDDDRHNHELEAILENGETAHPIQ